VQQHLFGPSVVHTVLDNTVLDALQCFMESCICVLCSSVICTGWLAIAVLQTGSATAVCKSASFAMVCYTADLDLAVWVDLVQSSSTGQPTEPTPNNGNIHLQAGFSRNEHTDTKKLFDLT
jgi:hypothetical protein